MQILKVALAGGGKMSSELFRLLSDKDFDLVLWTRRADAAAALEDDLLRKLRRRAAKGGEGGAEAEARLRRLTITSDLAALADADLIIESVAESLRVKQDLFKTLEAVVRPDAILATNTSSLSPSTIGRGLAHPERVAGLHFFYPVSLLGFVEVIAAEKTRPEVVEVLGEFVRKIGRRPVRVGRESMGYLVNRLLLAYYSEGAGVVGEGHWLPGEVDRIGKKFAMMGPCESIDHVGIDILLEGFDCADESWGRKDAVKHDTRGEHPFPPVYFLLRAQGRLGIKAGKGFYLYQDRKQLEDPAFYAEHAPSLPDYHLFPRGDEAIIEKRLWYSLVLESLVALEKGIGAAEDIDSTLKEVLGLEVPPLAFVEKKGLAAVRMEVEQLAAAFGPRFAPVGKLLQ